MVRIDLQYEDHEIPALIAALEGFCAEIVPHGKCARCGTIEREQSDESPGDEMATNRKSRIVQKKGKVPLTDEQKAQILEMHGGGKSIPEIKVALMIEDGRQIRGVIMGKRRRKTSVNVAPPQEPPGTHQTAVAEVMPPEAQSSEVPPDRPRTGPEPMEISRAEFDQVIWKLHKAKKTPVEISEELLIEGSHPVVSVVRQRLRAQGADL